MTKDNEIIELESKLSEWLSSEGYALEYATMHALREVGLNSTMGMYITSKEGIKREIDVTAIAENSRSDSLYIRVICECKYSRKKPWVMLQSGLSSGLPQDWQCLPHSMAIDEMETLLNRSPRFSEDLWHFRRQETVGHNIIQAFRQDNRDQAFAALQKIANAAWDWTTVTKQQSAQLICIPALILDGKLYEAWCPQGSDKFSVQEVHAGRLSWLGTQNGTMIDVVTLNGLNEWATNIKKTIEGIFSIYNSLD